MALPLLALGASALGAALRGIGAAQARASQAKQEERAAKHQAREYIRQSRFAAKDIRRTARSTAIDFLTQANIHDRQKILERNRGAYNVARLSERGERIIGEQVAAFSSSGLALSGTIAEVVQSTAGEIAKDIASTRYSTVIASENEAILAKINRKNARRAIRYGEASAKDALKYGKQAAKDTLKLGSAAGVAIRQGSGIAIAAPVIETAGTFLGSGAFGQS